MAKQIEDIIPNERKSIRDIPIPESRRKQINLIDNTLEPPKREISHEEPQIREPQQVDSFSRVNFERPSQPISDIKRTEVPTPVATYRKVEEPVHKDFSPSHVRRSLPKRPLVISGLFGLIILALGIFSLFDKTTVTYTPKSQAISFANETFTAKKEGAPEDLLFSVIKISQEKSTEAPASGEERVSQKASGVIIVYNNSSASSQRLIKNTRFETADGKVYRVLNDITVPGQKTVAGKSQPGSLEVTVYADQPGDSYNISLTDFTLPGLKGDPKFETIYARSKTPMTGGFVGTVKKVSTEDKAAAEKVIETQLKESLKNEASAQVPEDFVLIPNLTQVTFEKLPEGESTTDKALVRERGNFSGVIFNKSDLIRYIASKKTVVALTDRLDADLNKLDINFVQAPTGDLAEEEVITFTVSGDTMMLWISDEAAIARDLLGKSKSELQGVLNNYPSIIEADAVVRPFWKRSFPDEIENIKFIKNIK